MTSLKLTALHNLPNIIQTQYIYTHAWLESLLQGYILTTTYLCNRITSLVSIFFPTTVVVSCVRI